MKYTPTRTNIVIGDEFMRRVLEETGAKTKREAVDAGLRALLRLNQQKEVLKYFGTVQWEGDLEEMRRD